MSICLRPAEKLFDSLGPAAQKHQSQWRFYVGARGHRPPNLAQAPKFFIGFIVISLSRCCLPNDEGSGPPNTFS